MGQAVGPLRDEGVLLFGSGLSYHSMPGFSRNGGISHASAASKVCRFAVDILEDYYPPCSCSLDSLMASLHSAYFHFATGPHLAAHGRVLHCVAQMPTLVMGLSKQPIRGAALAVLYAPA